MPILVVEIASPFTRHRDAREKRALDTDAGVAENWIVDPEEREVRVVRAGHADLVTRDTLEWVPAGARESFIFDVATLF